MWEDPIVEEVHRTREKLAADCNYDIHEFFAGLRSRQTARTQQAEPAAEADRDRHSDSAGTSSPGTAPAA